MRIRSSVNRQDASSAAQNIKQTDDPQGADRRLGAILAREGLLSPEDVEQVAAAQASGNDLFGETAIASGKLTEAQRDLALMLQADQGHISEGDSRLDPMLVAAFDLNDNYVNRIRAIRTKILQAQTGGDVTDMLSCALIGLDCDEELAVISSNLAIVMARLGSPCLLVDASLHNPRLHELFRTENRSGLSNLRPDRSIEDMIQPTSLGNLWLLPAGPKSPDKGHAFERQALLETLQDWRIPSTKLLVSLALRSRDYIPTIGASLAGFDCIIPVVRKHETRIGDLRALIDRLDEQGITVLGMVMV